MIDWLRKITGATLEAGLVLSLFTSFTAVPVQAEQAKYSLETKMWDDPYDLYPDSLTTTVSLQFPSAEARINSDLVFVVDISDCVTSTLTSLQDMLTQLKESQDRQNVTTRIGIVFFRGSAFRFRELSELTDDVYQTISQQIQDVLALDTDSAREQAIIDKINAITTANQSTPIIASGSNLDSGLQAAQAMLAEETSAGNSQYVIAVSDGISYLFDDESGDTKNIYSGIQGSTEVTNIMSLFYEWESRYHFSQDNFTYIGEGTFTQEDWNTLFSVMQEKVAADAGAYDVSVRAVYSLYEDYRNPPLSLLQTKGFPYLLGTVEYLNSHAVGIEKGLVEAYDTWMELVNSGYQCFFVNPTFGDVTNSFPYFYTQMMNTASGQTGTVNFETITGQAINAVESAVVQDVINPEFTLTQEDGVLPFSMLRGEEQLACTADPTQPNTWYFGEDTGSGYPYVITYDPETQTILWDIRVPVVKGQELTLTYRQTLRYAGTELKEYPVSTSVSFTYMDSLGRSGTGVFSIPNVLYHPPVQATPPGRLVPSTGVDKG
jgi:hypothetical protein